MSDYDPHACDELTALDILLKSVEGIVKAHSAELAAGKPLTGSAKWRELHHDLWASYATYLYDQQHQDEPVTVGEVIQTLDDAQ